MQPLYVILYCLGSSCSAHTYPWNYTLTRADCIEAAIELRASGVREDVYCLSERHDEMVKSDGTVRYLIKEVR